MISDATESSNLSVTVETMNPPETVVAGQRKLNQLLYNRPQMRCNSGTRIAAEGTEFYGTP